MSAHDLPDDELPPAQPLRVLVWLYRTLHVAARRFARDQGFEKASALAYSSLLALVPAALLAVSVVELLDVEQRVAVTDWFLRLLFPDEAKDVREGFQRYLDESRLVLQGESTAGSVRIISVLVLVYFAGALLQQVDRVVRAVWGGGGLGYFLRRLSAYWAVVTVGPILLAFSFAATAFASDFLGESAGALFARLLPFGVTWLSVFLFYRWMPHSPVRWRAALTGAIVAGTLWEASKLGLGWYLARPKTLLTTLSFFPAALLWMYVSWSIAIFGLEVSYVVHHRNWRGGSRALPGARNGAARDALAVAVLVEASVAFDRGEGADRATIAERVGAAEDEVADVMGALERAGLLAAGSGGYRPARGASGIRAVDVIVASRGRADAAPLRASSPSAQAALAFTARLDRDGAAVCTETTIADLAKGIATPTP